MTVKNSKYKKHNQPTILEVLILGLFRMLWWLIKLPFGGGKGKKGIATSDKQEILKKRLELENFLPSNDQFALKNAVMEADKLVDYTLKISGYPGETFADRLRNAEANISSSVYNRVWQGHKVRNQIAHEHDLKIDNFELREAINNLLEYLKHV